MVKRKVLASGDFPESSLMMAARKSYTSVVSWLFPQMASQPKPEVVLDVEEDEDEIQVVEVVDGKKASELGSKSIKYDPLPSFKGFSRPPKRRKIPDDEESKEKASSKPAEVKLQTKTKSRLSKMLKSREIYRKMLEQKIKSNRRLEDLIKEVRDYENRSDEVLVTAHR